MKAEELINKYAEVKRNLDKLEEMKDEIRNEFAKILHSLNTNELLVNDITGKEWKISYSQSTRKSTNYDLLLATVGKDKFDDIVSTTTSTALNIKAAPKKKIKDITKIPPKEIKEQDKHTMPDVPVGRIN